MRHGKAFNHLKRTSPHRKATLSNMASSLIMHKRITTTLPKAKALRKYVEPIITRSKTDNTHSRRMAFSDLQDKYSVHELFTDVAKKVGDRPGGYTRVIKLGMRGGDSAEMAMVELVDYNEVMLEDSQEKSKTRRGRRRRGGKKGQGQVTEATEANETTASETTGSSEAATATQPADETTSVDTAATDSATTEGNPTEAEDTPSTENPKADAVASSSDSESDADSPSQSEEDQSKEGGEDEDQKSS